jgi:N-carbamoyl-L-amino-acid hydrolase
VLEAEGIATAAVEGCVGIERHRFTIRGQASHAGTTPMLVRRDAGLAAAEAALAIERIAVEHDGLSTTGALRLEPGIPTAVAGIAELVADLRHPDPGELATMLDEAGAAVSTAAAGRGCEVASQPIWRIEPIPFDPGLVAAARAACRAAGGSDRTVTSGALHDAAEVARVLPAAMVFCPSIAGISHAVEEDTPEADLATGVEAYGALAASVLTGAAS